MTTGEEAGLRCSDWSRANRVDPAGTAGCYQGYLLVEWPLPWPADVGEIEELAALKALASERGLRLQAVVPGGPGRLRVCAYTKGEGPFRAYEGRESWVTTGSLAKAGPGAQAGDGANGVADRRVSAAPAAQGDREGPTGTGQALLAAAGELLAGGGSPVRRREVLVCTHGRRDRCCGALGTDLYRRLIAGEAGLDRLASLGRTSHTGGHRFAPTAIVLPEGTVWGYLDADALSRIVAREGPLEDLLPRYRGCSALESPAIQALERAVLARLGWSLFDCAREGRQLEEGRVHLAVHAEGNVSLWEAAVAPGRTLPVPDCGAPVERATKSETEHEVLGLSRVA